MSDLRVLCGRRIFRGWLEEAMLQLLVTRGNEFYASDFGRGRRFCSSGFSLATVNCSSLSLLSFSCLEMSTPMFG